MMGLPDRKASKPNLALGKNSTSSSASSFVAPKTLTVPKKSKGCCRWDAKKATRTSSTGVFACPKHFLLESVFSVFWGDVQMIVATPRAFSSASFSLTFRCSLVIFVHCKQGHLDP